ncbi:BglG family transcription antiterminator [Tetragenococcus halophilus]|uniref:DeoR family transcriptional regulator n=1 Tax=Tetragenococcus halophilus (strain DSM 20338 / JCM 20259 / NCIMB 9735 / NBRC 12172) TaxID=945021 RepID=A0AAN1SH49_TETHN|nr:PTS sugar transporter subunit IIA [Tetragenococcus halophilus]RQD32558.1 PRD domain-containing protein [Tetragenococcus halophilus subsp. halophilus DSM 20339]WJS81135.1 BglG family transcription antiterminator [Tetragenococcus halophilus]BAK94481.1 putative DeoR family transcriptional regulator [Tetragenococcus halophilus NBRC 12172]GBD59485.1 putative DeoR family transcriptional regulator [Tetragenococcus halophilus subsp. halophilus]GBD62266.1 putative DeoR family transcriptional regulat
MLSERSQLILTLILEKKTIELNDIAKLLGVSPRTVRNHFLEIDEFLHSKNLNGLEKQVQVTYSLNDSKSSIEKALSHGNSSNNKEDFWQEPSFRLQFLYNKLFWEERRITIEYFMDCLLVSRSTVNNDLKELRKIAWKKDISIYFEKKRGFYLSGSEENQRELYFIFIEKAIHSSNYLKELETSDRSFINYWIKKVEEELMIQMTDDSFQKFEEIIVTIIKRIKSNKYVSENYKPAAGYSINELEIVSNNCHLLERYFDILFDSPEILFLSNQLYQRHFIKNEVIYQGFKVNLDILANNVITEISKKLNIDLTKDKELYENLALHFQTTITKDTDISDLINEEMYKKIRNMYPTVYVAVKKVMKQVFTQHHISISDDKEYSFVTLHLISSMEKMKNIYTKNLNVFLVCHMGVGTSQFLKNKLEQHFNFPMEVVTKDYLQAHLYDADMIISTVPLEDIDIPFVEVSAVLSEIDVNKIQLLEKKILDEKMIQEKSMEGSYEPMLKELLTENTIDTQVNVNDWKEAIIYGGKILEEEGTIDRTYTNSMVESVEKFGPYIVIAPHIALAHASSKDGVHKIGMSLITLDKGINFGNKENDPVYTVICLAAIDHNSHLKALSELVEALKEEQFNRLLRSSDKEGILQYIDKTGI